MNDYKKYEGKLVVIKLKNNKDGKKKYLGIVCEVEFVNPVSFIIIKNALGKKQGFYDKEISSIKEIIK